MNAPCIFDDIEEWRDIPGYEGAYQVSDLGRVRSLARTTVRSNGRPIPVRARILKPKPPKKYGHRCVSLSCVERGDVTREVHILVALAFLGPRPSGMQVAHRDGNAGNNCVYNLRYATRASNMLDISLHDRQKISRSVVKFIKAFTFFGPGEMSEITGVSRAHIWNIRTERQRANG